MDIFNSREIATAVWLFIFFIFMLTKKDVRLSLFKVVECLFGFKMLLMILLLLLYMTAIIFILKSIGFWELYLLKDSIIWFVFTGFQIFINSTSFNRSDHFMTNYLTKNLKLDFALEYIVNIKSFPLVVELLLIPVLVIIGGLDAVANFEPEKNKLLIKLIKIVEAIIGLVILVYITVSIIIHFKEMINVQVLKDFLLFPILTIALIPYIYFFNLYVAYETLFIRFRTGGKNEEIMKYAKRKIITFCLLSLKRLNQISNLEIYNFFEIRTKDDVNQYIQTHKNYRKGLRV